MLNPTFADCEGNDLLPGLHTMWTIQIAQGVDGEVEVYADQDGYPALSEGLKVLRETEKVVFHNGMGYDLFAINKLYPKTLVPEQIIDSLVISRLMDSTATRHSLKELGDALGYPKGEFHDFSQFSKEMVRYGKQDVKILQEAWKGRPKKVRSFGHFYEEFHNACNNEFFTAYVIQKQINHGFRLNFEQAQLLEAEFRQEQLTIERELQRIFPPITHKRVSDKTGKPLKDKIEVFNPGSRDQIADRLIAKYKWKPTSVTRTGKAKIDETVLNELPYPEAKEVARYLTIGKMIGQVSDGANAWLKLAVQDNRGHYYCHGYVNTLGARTHRMSHSKPNMAQVNKKDHRMRKVWMADPGWDLVGVDAEGLELRMLAHYLFPYDEGVYVDIVHSGDKKLGTDIHTVNMKAAGLYLRDSAKTMIYAHNYGCFDKKLGIIVQDDARESGNPIPVGSPSALGAALRANIEVGILGLGQLINKCKRAHDNRSALPGLDGRWIPSASDHSALNTLLQGNGSIVMKVALNEFEREMTKLQLNDKFHYCANVHDEFQITSHPDFSQKVADVGKWSIAQAGLILDVRCPLLGDAVVGKTWADTH